MTRFDEKIPIAKKETSEIKGTLFSYIFWPIETAGATKDWTLNTWSQETEKCGGRGIIASTKGAASTSLIAASNSLNWMSNFMAQKKEEAKQVTNEKTSD